MRSESFLTFWRETARTQLAEPGIIQTDPIHGTF
jgi:hypothetical protein